MREGRTAGGRRRKIRRSRAVRRSRRTAVLVALLCTCLAVLLVALAGGGVALSAYLDNVRKAVTGLPERSLAQNSVIYARDGSVLEVVPSEENRTQVPLSAVSPWLQVATVAIEDRRFYEHQGVDWRSVARAVATDVRAGHAVQGASTLTQQLMRALYLDDTHSLDRKVKEAYLALEYEKTHTKGQILEKYLNTVPYGHFAYGAEAAAQAYFGIHVRNLTMVQSALIAGLPQAPSRFDPWLHPVAATTRREEVLAALRETGVITGAQYAVAVATPLGLHHPKALTKTAEPYFVQYVVNALNADPQFGSDAVRHGGLRVHTTIDSAMQKQAYSALRSVMRLPPCANRPQPTCDPAAAMVVIDPHTGEIRAMAATQSFSRSQVNLAEAVRQPGSTFKPFTLAAAMEQGMDPSTTLYESGPFTFGKWQVHTAEPTAPGPKTVEAATVASDNTVFAQLAIDVGPEKIRQMAQRLGITQSLNADANPGPSITLGAYSVKPLEMASAYATFAAMGTYHRAHAIAEIDYAGSAQRLTFKARAQRVLSDGIASEVNRILGENIRYGTGTRARTSDGRPQAGKTGTTDKEVDAWFCGYTPDLAACVWVGYPRYDRYPMSSVEGASPVFGGTLPAEIWHGFMQAVLVGRVPAHDWPAPRHPFVGKPWSTRYTQVAANAASSIASASSASVFSRTARTDTGTTGTGGTTSTGPTGSTAP
jgi:penicillin-binding protein 1A